MATPSMDALTWFRKQVEAADADLLREMITTFAGALLTAEADALCGAGYGERTPERVNSRNGYRERPWDTRTGTIDLAIPKLRSGSYFPDWLLEQRRRSERALVAVVAECYVRGVSTRRVEGLVRTLGIERLSKSQVSAMAQELDPMVASFRNRPLDPAGYPYLWVDALTQRVREDGRIVNVCAVVATGVTAEGKREILGVDVVSAEDGAAWTAFLRGLVARGLRGVRLVISDAHEGLKNAIAAVLDGASWQRCRTHFMRNLLSRVPRSTQAVVATLVRSTFAQPDAQSTWAQLLALTRMSSLSLTGFHGGHVVRSTTTRWRWQYSVEIAERASVRLSLVIHREPPTQAQLRVLDGYPVRWHLPSRPDRDLLRSDRPSLWRARRDRLTCHS